jgi:di/tricarboxylate transporter
MTLPGLFGLGFHGTAILCFAALVFLLLAWDRWPIETVSLIVLVALPLLFLFFPYEVNGAIVRPYSLFFGFGHEALVAICALMIVGRSLVVTGALEPAARRMAKVFEKKPRIALLLVLVAAMAASGLVNDTPIVVILIPLLAIAVQKARQAAAALLMPMNFAVLVGGMATTIGTSTNLIVVSTAADLGLPRFGLFDFYPLVAVAAVPALFYLWLVAPRLLRSVPAADTEQDAAVFEAEIYIGEHSKADGKSLDELLKDAAVRPRIREIRRGPGTSIVPRPSVQLQGNDRLLVRGTVDLLKELARTLDGELHGARNEPADDQEKAEDSRPAKDEPTLPRNELLAQMIVTEDSRLAQSTVRRARLASLHEVVMIGLRRSGHGAEWSRRDLADAVLKPGDVLLLQGTPDALREAQASGMGLLLNTMTPVPRADKAPIALAVLAAIVVVAAFKIVPIGLAALAGVAALMLSECIGWRDATSALSAKVVLLVASSLALGQALVLTGGIDFLAGQLHAATGQLGARWVLVLLLFLMGGVTNFVSNNAAAAIGTPLGVALASSLGAPAEPFVLAVLFGCNLCYVTPMGYQTNLLVMNAAGYRFSDFVRVGAPLFALMGTALSAALILSFGL